CFFFFQAEDGIRDKLVTGVQTCALPIYSRTRRFLLNRAVLDEALSKAGTLYTDLVVQDTTRLSRNLRVLLSAMDRLAKANVCLQIGRASCRERVEISVGARAV